MLRKLAGQTAIYGFSTIGVRLLNYVLTPYLTRILTKSQYGDYTLIYSYIPFLLVLLIMGLETGYFRFYADADTGEKKKRLFETTWGAVFWFSILFLGIVIVLNSRIAAAINLTENPSFIWLTGGIVALDAITSIPFAKLRAEGKAKQFVIIRLVTVIINVSLCFFFYSALPKLTVLYSLWNPDYGAGYALIANFIQSGVALILLLPFIKGAIPRIDPKLGKSLVIYSLPLLIAAIPGVANEFIDRTLIDIILPEESARSYVGVYGAVTKLAVIMSLFVQMYRYAAEPFFLSRMKKDEFVQTNAEAMKYFIVASIVIFLGITFYSDIFAYILGKDFREGVALLPVILMANLLMGIVVNLSFWYKHSGKTKFALIITLSGLLVTILLNIYLIPRIGYAGGAWSRMACEGVMVIISYLLCQRFFPIPYNLKRIGLYFLSGVVIFVIGQFINVTTPRYISFFLDALLVVGFVLLVVYKEKIDVKLLFNDMKHHGNKRE